jgi:rubrerythrin
MTPVEALELALNKEREAMELYQKFARELPSAREVFEFLVGEESKHKLIIEKKISEMMRL